MRNIHKTFSFIPGEELAKAASELISEGKFNFVSTRPGFDSDDMVFAPEVYVTNVLASYIRNTGEGTSVRTEYASNDKDRVSSEEVGDLYDETVGHMRATEYLIGIKTAALQSTVNSGGRLLSAFLVTKTFGDDNPFGIVAYRKKPAQDGVMRLREASLRTGNDDERAELTYSIASGMLTSGNYPTQVDEYMRKIRAMDEKTVHDLGALLMCGFLPRSKDFKAHLPR